jgi:predicted RND superfamily exporter protein
MKKKSKRTNIQYDNFIFSQKNTMNLTLHVIGLIIITYGAWFNNILWMLLGLIPMFIGHWWEKVNKK